jgi:hypothetical protein
MCNLSSSDSLWEGFWDYNQCRDIHSQRRCLYSLLQRSGGCGNLWDYNCKKIEILLFVVAFISEGECKKFFINTGLVLIFEYWYGIFKNLNVSRYAKNRGQSS